jgi:ubiquinone/menaquinone biosynthesis C-methylase UbiE
VHHSEITFAFKPFAEWLCDLLCAGKGGKVLDVGCGKGISTSVISERISPDGFVVGVDVDSKTVTQLRRRFKRKNVKFLVCSAESLSNHFKEASFDVVISNYSFHLFKNLEKSLEQMICVLKPGGKLGIVTPGPKHVKEFRETLTHTLKKFGLLEKFARAGALVMSKEDLKKLIKRHGIEIKRHDIFEKRIIVMMKNVYEYLDHLEARGAKSRVLNRIPRQLQKNFWKKLGLEMTGAYGHGATPMTLHAIALTAEKAPFR